jgi:PhnB protein
LSFGRDRGRRHDIRASPLSRRGHDTRFALQRSVGVHQQASTKLIAMDGGTAMANVKAVPDGYTTITASLMFRDSNKAIEFYKKALGAKERSRMIGPDDKVMHAELTIGNTIVMLGDEMMDYKSAESIGSSPVAFYVYVDGVDAAFQKAVAAGGKQVRPVTDMFWGDRVGQFEDPFGYRWSLATHVKDLSPKEMESAMEDWMRQAAAK